LDSPEGQHHSIEEAVAAIHGLPDAYFLRLERWAAWKLAYNGVEEAGDVIADTFERFQAGTRRWPVGVSIQACFKNAVRSLIDEAWEKHDRIAARQHAPVTVDCEPADPFENVLDPIEGRPMQALTRADPLELIDSADEQRRQNKIVNHIESAFGTDEDVTALLIGLEQDLPAREIQQAFDLTETQYDSARKRLRRFLNKHYPNQWRSHGQEPDCSS
jgi:hypothetical protein